MPRKKKSPGEAVDPRNGQSGMKVYVDDQAQRVKPPAPKGLLGETRRVWDAYWSDVVSGVVRESEYALVRRWIANFNRYLKLLELADKEPITTGSTGQQVVNPALTAAMRIEPGLRYDEMQLGWGPKNRTDLGISIVAGSRSLAEMNREVGGDAGGDGQHEGGAQLYALPSAEEDDDPRRDAARR